MRKLDILLYTRASGGGGAERVWAILANGLAARGHRVTFAFDETTTNDGVDPTVETIDVGKRHPVAVLRLARLLRARRFDVIAAADFVLDLGPEGGERGGTIVCQGPPEAIARSKASRTGRYLAPVLARGRARLGPAAEGRRVTTAGGPRRKRS